MLGNGGGSGSGGTATTGGYRYGFNGQEKSDEIKGEGNSYTAEFWEYDPRIGRRWNLDPVVKTWESGYVGFANSPIWFSDQVGLDTLPANMGERWKTFNSEKDNILLKEVVVKPEQERKENTGSHQGPIPKSTQVAQAVQQTHNINSLSNIQVTLNRNLEVTENGALPEVPQVLPDRAWITQAPNWTACFQTCRTILITSGIRDPAPKNLLIQMVLEDKKKKSLLVQPSAQTGLNAIDASLDNGRPIIVGVNHTIGNTYNEGTTDHFVVIIARGYENGVLFYRFFDVGTARKQMGASPDNRLYLRNNSILSGRTMYTNHFYTVSQVRPN